MDDLTGGDYIGTLIYQNFLHLLDRGTAIVIIFVQSSNMLFNLSFISTEELQELFVTESQRFVQLSGQPIRMGQLKKIINDLQSIHSELNSRIGKKQKVI
jgi:hypothetical protein